jgi:hypothetical protein
VPGAPEYSLFRALIIFFSFCYLGCTIFSSKPRLKLEYETQLPIPGTKTLTHESGGPTW